MSKTVNMHQAKTQLSRLVEAALQGEQVTIAKAGKPLVRLVPVSQTEDKRPTGALKAQMKVSGDFDAPILKQGPLTGASK